MVIGNGGDLGRPLRAALALGAARDLTDGQLLERFAGGRGDGAELAFEALVERHGAMVRRVARSILPDPTDADDAFQATFLVLVARARGLRARDSLGPWLYQVAHRTASCQRAAAARRRRLDRRVVLAAGTARPEPDAELARVVHEEVARLPERYRAAVVLCDLEGRTHEQAARALGIPVGTVKSRQARARDRLRVRLTRRGVAPGLTWGALWPVAGPLFPPTLIHSTTAAAVRYVASRAIAPGPAAALAREVIRAMMIWQWGKVASVLLALGAVSGAGLIAQDAGKPPSEGPKAASQPTAPPPPGDDPGTVAVRPGKLTWTLAERGVVESSQARDVINQVAGSTVITSVLPDGSRVKEGDVVAELDSATLRDTLTNQKIATQQAEAAYKQALLTREVAEFAVREYVEGVAPQDIAELEGKVAQTQADLDRARARLERTKQAQDRAVRAGTHRPGPEAPGDILAALTIADRLEAAEASLQGLMGDHEAAKGRQANYQKYTLEKSTRQLRKDVEQTRAVELSKQSSWELERVKEAKLERQIKACRLVAPADGLINYANDPNRLAGQGQLQIEAGATVRERQKLLSVVDLDGPMRVQTKVAEAVVDRLELGQPVRIKVQALPNEVLTGVVRAVAPRADPSTMAAAGKKVYPTLIQFDKAVPNLRPGMVAAVDITLFDLDDVLSVPVGALVRVDAQDRVAVRSADGGVELRAVTLGRTNGPAVEVKAGLKPGDRVFLDPAGFLAKPPRAN